jgi:hypothetical protein
MTRGLLPLALPFVLASIAALPALAAAQTTTVEVLVVDVQVTTVEPSPAPIVEPTSPPESANDGPLVPVLRTRAELVMIGGDYDGLAAGGSALIGARLGSGFSGGLVVGYLSEIWSGPAEVDLALEVEKDFSPLDAMGLVLLARFGTGFMLADGDARHDGMRMIGQLGIGGRFDLDPRVAALTLDLRGVIRYRPDGDGATREDVSAGLAVTLGLVLRLD